MILTHVTAATMRGGYGLIPEAAVVVEGDRIAWVGPAAERPPGDAVDGGGRLLTPALIDAHTHIVFAGDRAAEFEMRLKGASYAEIARAGGGILSTVRATRAAAEDELVALALPRLDALLAAGAGTVEVKSGYGLTVADELKLLRAARRLGTLRPAATIRTSHLAAHAVPPEFAGRPEAYIDEVAIPSLQAAHAEGLVDAVDAFCETIAFGPSQVARLFDAAAALGLPVRLHAEQLSNLHGAALAAARGALSADHLEYLDAEGVAAMAAAGTVAGLLPGAFYTLRERQAPPVAALRAAGVPMMVATDWNPGSSPLSSPTLAMNMACTLFGLTPEEALMGTTVHAARALGLADRGAIAPGLRADLVLWEARHPAELSWRIGGATPALRILGGARV